MLKAILWVCLVVGLGPVCLLAAYVLVGQIAAAAFKSEMSQDFSQEGMTLITFMPIKGLGAARHAWPAIAVLLGAGAVSVAAGGHGLRGGILPRRGGVGGRRRAALL